MRWFARLAPSLVLTAGMTACGGAPPRTEPHASVALPDDWSAARAPAQISAAWSSSFTDPRLLAIVDEALAHNWDLAAASARLDAAVAEARIAGADVFPVVNARASATRQQQVFTGLPIPSADGPLTSRSTNYGVSLDFQWELDLWGRLRGTRSAAGADFAAAAADYEGARLSLTAQTIKAWFAAAESRRQLELAETTHESFTQTTRRIRALYESGARPSLDLRLARSDEASAEATVALRRDVHERTLRQLELLLGRYPSATFEPAGELIQPPAEIPEGLPAQLLARRPDLVAAERRVAAAGARVGSSRAALLPRITLTASGGAVSDDLRQLLDGDFRVWSLAAGLLQPLFQGGRLRANLARSQSIEDQAVASYAGAVLRACGEVENALHAEQSLAVQEASLTRATDEARAAFDLARSRYDTGVTDAATLLSARRAFTAAESRLLEVRRQRLDARVDLHLALGGGFTAGVPKAES